MIGWCPYNSALFLNSIIGLPCLNQHSLSLFVYSRVWSWVWETKLLYLNFFKEMSFWMNWLLPDRNKNDKSFDWFHITLLSFLVYSVHGALLSIHCSSGSSSFFDSVAVCWLLSKLNSDTLHSSRMDSKCVPWLRIIEYQVASIESIINQFLGNSC